MPEPRHPGKRKMQVVAMEMNNVKLLGAVEHLFQHREMVRELVDALMPIQSERFRAARY
jgi:hypothetical protein